MIYTILFTVLVIIITIFIANGFTEKPHVNTQQADILKNTVIGTNSLLCNDGEVVNCNNEDIGAYLTSNGGGGDEYCSSICRETESGINMVCAVANDKTELVNGQNKHTNNRVCMPSSSKEFTKECDFKHGGELVWTGSTNSDNMGWQCMCQWPQYAGGENCKDINPGVCGSHGKDKAGVFDWDASVSPPELVNCKCNTGYTWMKSLEGKADICVKTIDANLYLDLYSPKL
jgi:hypothetical protein